MGFGFWEMSVERAEQQADRMGGATGITASQGIGEGSVPTLIAALGPLLGGHLGECDELIDRIIPSEGTSGPFLP